MTNPARMNSAVAACDLCDAESSVLIRGRRASFAVCPPCAKRVAERIAESDPRSLSPVWRAHPAARACTGAADAEVHADLALAYLEMGLLSDALTEAAEVLGRGATPAATVAVDVLFNERLAHPNALEGLRRLLFPN